MFGILSQIVVYQYNKKKTNNQKLLKNGKKDTPKN